jgi:hypothetical protein
MFKQGDNYNRASMYHLQDASFIRLKNLELAYNLGYLKGLPDFFKEVKVYLRGTNLWTLSSVKYYDPEASNQDLKYFPQQTTFIGGLTITIQ